MWSPFANLKTKRPVTHSTTLAVVKPSPAVSAGCTWPMMLQVYELRLRDLEYMNNVGHGLMAAVTLSAALGAPLLIIGTERTWPNFLFGVGLLVYLVTITQAVRHAFDVLYSPIQSRDIRGTGHGIMHWQSVAAYRTPREYSAFAAHLTESERWQSLAEQDWIAAKLVHDKSGHTMKAVRWARISLFTLASLVILRFVITIFA